MRTDDEMDEREEHFVGIRWVSKREAAYVHELMSGDHVADSLGLNDGPRVMAGFFYLINAEPTGGWKGNMWTIVWSDLTRTDNVWYRTADEARQAWQHLEAISEAQTAASG